MTVYRHTTPQSSKFHFKQVIGVIFGCLLVNGLLFSVLYRHWEYQTIIATLESERDLNFETLRREEIVTSRELHSPAWTLIEETRAIIAEAGGEPGTGLSVELRKAWEDRNPCAGRRPLTRLWNRQKLRSFGDPESVPSIPEPSVLLYALYEEYANLHRTCTKGGDMRYTMEQYRSANSTGPCKFLVVEFGTYGIGNRMLWLISAFQYALLTKRVLLIDTRSTIHELLCQPFPGSSWLLSQDFEYSSEQRWPMPSEFQEEWDDWESKESEVKKKAADLRMRESNALRKWDKMSDLQHLQERRETLASVLSRIQAEVDRNAWELEMTEQSFGKTRQLIEHDPQPSFFRVQGNDGWAPNPRFFCENEQQHLHTVKWISMNSGCLYFLPNLFAVPSFRPILEELYPDRDPVTHLLRHLTLPVNSIWENVRATYKKHFSSASKVVGIQVRYRDGPLMYRNLNEIVNGKIYRCSVNNGILPQPAAVMSARRSMDNNHEGPVVIFVASLYSGLADHLQRIYSKAIESSSRPLRLVQLSEVRYQTFEAEGDHQAFMEILCLSLADEIVTSPVSTFGQMAQGYGALVPWLLNFSPDAKADCVRGQSSDACYQQAIDKFTCPLDPQLHGVAMMDMVPYLKPCQDTGGLQLIPPWNILQP